MIESLPGRGLVERFTDEPVEALMSRLPAAEAFTVVEHLHGVRPLVQAFFNTTGEMGEVASGARLGSLGLFSPTPGLRWLASALEGESAGGDWLLKGRVRIPSPDSDGALVLVRRGDERRLAWVERGAPGVERCGTRTPCWLSLDGAAVAADLVSRPVTLADLHSHLEAYAGVWARAAAICARDGARALRRAARTAGYNASQVVAMGITEVEIPAELTAAAAAQGGGLVLAAAAARTLEDLAVKTAELRDRLGLALDGPFADEESAKTLSAFLGGVLMLESEVGHALGIPEEGE